ncbi:sodium:solute symporter family protein [Candidatus Cardinium sp. cBcalN1]|uniref:sodium:solute symporter family protein n=2 Tax=unclassified Candidatus Cardinium TaxID=2641185 RepID=UPI001FB42A02|nr:sodium:solute symporter family protein [Candidatus Cardinium sp. cBcalN1]
MYIDYTIMIIFLLITLVIGLYASKRIHTFKAYAVGTRELSTFALTASLIATVYGGGFLDIRLNDYYHRGFDALIRDFIFPIGYYCISRFIIVRMKAFMGHLSIAESMGMWYGPSIRAITASFGILMAIAMLAIQFKVGLKILHAVFPTMKDYALPWAIVLSLIVIVYASFGGAKAVILTDVYQFFLFFVCFPIIIFTLLHPINNLGNNWQAFIQIPKFNPENAFRYNNMLAIFITYTILILFSLNPSDIQRVYMSSSVQQASKVFCNTAIIDIILLFLMFTLAIALYVGGHKIGSEQNILDYLLELDYYTGIKGLLVSTIIALLMSTADSELHIASVLCTNDLLPCLFKKATIFHTPSLRIARIVSCIIGLLSLGIAFYTTSILQLLSKSALFYLSIITVLFITICFGFRFHLAAVLCSMGISTTLGIYKIFIKGQMIAKGELFQSAVINSLLLFIFHYLLPKQGNRGWVGIPDDSPVQLQRQETKRWWLRKWHALHAVFSYIYWRNLFPTRILIFILTGAYFILYSSVALYYIKSTYVDDYIYWYIAIMAIGTVVALYPALHTYKEISSKLLHIVWPILLYGVFFITGITYIKLSHFAPVVYTFFIVNIGVSSLFLPFMLIVSMLASALLIHKWILPTIALVNYNSLISFEVFIGLIILISLLLHRYVRNKTNQQLQIISLARSYERHAALESLYNQTNLARLDPTYSGKILQEIANRLKASAMWLHTNGQLDLEEQLNLSIKQLYTFSRSLLQRAKAEMKLTLDAKSLKQVSIEPIILKAYELTRNLGNPMRLLLRNESTTSYLMTDPVIFERIFTINFWEISQSKQAIDHTVILTISDTLLIYPDPKHYQETANSVYEKKSKPPILSALAFCITTETVHPKILASYDVTDEITSVYLPKTTENLYQAESRQIIQAHGGYIQITETETSLTCLYLLPIDGRKVMRFKRYHTDDLLNKVAETPMSLNKEQELITLLERNTNLTEQDVQKTISFIKEAHGTAMRKSGEPYYTHPMAVAEIVLTVTKDPDTILAALLHDLIEDTNVTLNYIELKYGSSVAYIVDMLTHYNTFGYPWKLDKSDKQELLDACKDIRVVQVKLADRLHNLRTIAIRKPVDQLRIVKETRVFYIPWAKKHNLTLWAAEMEAICKSILAVYVD